MLNLLQSSLHSTNAETSMKAWEYRNIPFAERVRMHVVKSSNGCHNFEGRKDSDGYGQIKDKGKPVSVHRWIWEQAHGPITDGRHVLHSCDNRSCVNLAHLHIGSHADNMREKAARGRSDNVPRGAAHTRPMAKITEKEAREIKALLARGYRQSDIARDYRVSRSMVNDIAQGKTWGWVDGQ